MRPSPRHAGPEPDAGVRHAATLERARARTLPGRNPLAPRSIVVVPYGSGIGDLALQRGLLAGIRRRWPGATLSLYAPARDRAFVPDGIRVRPRVLGIPAWDRVPGAERWWRLLGPLEWRAIDVAFGRISLDRVAHLPARALAQRFDLAVDFLGTFVEGVDFGREPRDRQPRYRPAAPRGAGRTPLSRPLRRHQPPSIPAWWSGRSWGSQQRCKRSPCVALDQQKPDCTS
jgi:hypothetical protein